MLSVWLCVGGFKPQMCGRFAQTLAPEAMRRLFKAMGDYAPWQPRYNVAPQSDIPVIRAAGREGGRQLTSMRWGLIPHWAKDAAIGANLINARAETLAEKPSFRDSFAERRCLVPASAYYEWRKMASGKQPYAIRLKDEPGFAIAGLWSAWRAPEGDTLLTVCLITTAANPLLAPIHDRMPVIVSPVHYDLWLHGPKEAAQHLLVPFPAERMEAWPVSRSVGNPRNEGEGLLARLPPRRAQPSLIS